MVNVEDVINGLVGIGDSDKGGAVGLTKSDLEIAPNRSFNHIRDTYRDFLTRFGSGENPYFSQAPNDAVLMNCHANGRERPLFYNYDDGGRLNKWMTQEGIDQLPKSELSPEQLEAVLYDMFTLMLGGIDPEINELGINSLVELADEIPTSGERNERILKIFSFVKAHPNTNLTDWLYSKIGLSFSCHNLYKTRVAERDDKVILTGKGCFHDDKLIVWHVIRNMREGSYSHLKQDGEVFFPLPFDIQLVYQKEGVQRITRVNSTVFFLARHGLSEDETKETEADQVYISLNEYYDHIYVKNNELRRVVQERREENFAIANGVDGYEMIVEARKRHIMEVMVRLDEEGKLDPWVDEIDGYLAPQQE